MSASRRLLVVEVEVVDGIGYARYSEQNAQKRVEFEFDFLLALYSSSIISIIIIVAAVRPNDYVWFSVLDPSRRGSPRRPIRISRIR